jgi:hypothetical protein
VIVAGIILIVGMFLFPPWRGTRSGGFFGKDRTVALGYYPVFDPPSIDDAEIDGTRVFIQLIIIMTICAGLFFVLKKHQVGKGTS